MSSADTGSPTASGSVASATPLLSVAGGVDALEQVRKPVDRLLASFLDRRVEHLASVDTELEPIGREVAELVMAGGKRLRPAFVYWGHRATAAEHDDALFHPAAAVELLHTFALIHDDVMDRSASRRGRPAIHTSLAHRHQRSGQLGDPAWFGVGGAILAGDLAFVWADELLDDSPLPGDVLQRARRVFTELRIEVMAGQYLDLKLAGSADATEQRARQVALLKSGRYTVMRPLQLGATIAGGHERLRKPLAAYGDAVGLSFQLRDDVLGLFGDPAATGKSALDDLRQGKRTVLVLHALRCSNASARNLIEAALGDPDVDEAHADRVRDVIVASGALGFVESLVAGLHEEALAAVSGLPEPARDALEQLAGLATFRLE